ncbi:MAG: hypothetical protein ACSHYF_09620 [Verrucomicrobiaceae bacterium]
MRRLQFPKHTLSFLLTTALTSVGSGQALLVDFNSTTQDGGPHNELNYQAYNAGHEVETDFITQSFSALGSSISITPSWPDSTANTVMQMIDRAAGNDNNWGGSKLDLITDFIGIDTRTSQGGNGDFDGTTGTATTMLVTLSGIPANEYSLTSYHHDTENVHTDFLVEVSTDEGATFSVISGPNANQTFSMTSSTGTGNPVDPNPQNGIANPSSGDPRDLPSTVTFIFTATGDDVVLRYTPYSTTAVHKQIFALNGLELAVTGDTDGDGMPDLYETLNGLDPNDDGTIGESTAGAKDGPNGAAGDPDNDGLTNFQEYLGNDATIDSGDETDPQDDDTDDDTLTDGDEVNIHGTSPVLADTDGDYFTDDQEIAAGTSPTDNSSFSIPSTGLLIDFSSTGGGPDHDPDYLPYVGPDQTDGETDKSVIFPTTAFGGSNDVTLAVDYPIPAGGSWPRTVKRLLTRGGTQYQGANSRMIRDWIGVDARVANGGGGVTDRTEMRFTLTGLPAGKYLYISHHHDTQNITGDFQLRLTDANHIDAVIFEKSGTTSATAAVSAGASPRDLPSTSNFLIESTGPSTPIEVVYSVLAGDDGAGGEVVAESLFVVNGLEIYPDADTDGDLIPDSVENTITGLNPNFPDASGDIDNDNLSNIEEFYLGTNIELDDTDGDGLKDGAEVNTHKTDPFDMDTDNDGLLDGQEINDLASNPLLADTDSDTFSDFWEFLAGSALNDLASFPDQDLDGYSQVNDIDDNNIAIYPQPLPNQLFIDFNSNQAGGGDSAGAEPEESTAAFNQLGYQSYHANHEAAEEFTPGSYVAFGKTITVTPTWPDTSDNRVQQSIGRGEGNNDNWHGDRVNLLSDWLGIDTRTGNGGLGDYDGTTGTPTRMRIALGGLPAGNYSWLSFHHDTENVHAPFAVSVSTDGGTTFVPVTGPNADGTFPMTNSTGGGNPVAPVRYQGAENPGSIDPAALPSSVRFNFTADGTSDVIFEFTPYSNTAVHRQLFAINGFELTGPADPLGAVRVTATARNNNGDFLMLIKGAPNSSYKVTKSLTLNNDFFAFEPEMSFSTDSDGEAAVIIPGALGENTRAFFRIEDN